MGESVLLLVNESNGSRVQGCLDQLQKLMLRKKTKASFFLPHFQIRTRTLSNFTVWKVTISLEQVQASLVWNDTQRRPWVMVGTRLLNLLKVGIVEENWKEDMRETAGSDPVSEARVHSATSARPGCSKFVVEDFERKCGNFVWLNGLLLETGALTSFQVADNEEEKNLLEETRMCRDPV
ncbi:hypothetical protein ACFX1X_027821 [Malus domestica]